jgi:hypothetical protein
MRLSETMYLVMQRYYPEGPDLFCANEDCRKQVDWPKEPLRYRDNPTGAVLAFFHLCESCQARLDKGTEVEWTIKDTT